MRFGLVGTGHWARIVHAPALAGTPGIELVAVWGRNPAAADVLASQVGATAHHDFDTFLADVEAVAFSIPPDVQSALAVRAAQAGKHLLLEKPIALDETAADDMVAACEQAGVATVVFFTGRFQPEVRAWLDDVKSRRWTGGQALWLGSALSGSSPFDTPWRRAKGGLWDVGPHAVSMLSAALGPVVAVTADAGLEDVTHLVLHHESGVTSAVTLTQHAPPGSDGLEAFVWGPDGRWLVPETAGGPVAALQVAAAELVANAGSGTTTHDCDVEFGRDITRVLAAAQRQIDSLRAHAGDASTGR
jgi:predicted dehydrogenase